MGSGFGSPGAGPGTALALQIPRPPGHCQGLSKAVCVQSVPGGFGGGLAELCTIWVRAGAE